MKKDDLVRRDAFTIPPEEGTTDEPIFMEVREAKVCWVNEEAASIQIMQCGSPTKGYTSLKREEDGKWYSPNEIGHGEYYVYLESAPNFQSQVAQLSDEELHAQVESLRSGRTAVAQEAKAKKPRASKEDNQLSKALAELTPEAQAELIKKLGL